MKISCFVGVGVFACILLPKTWGTNSACDLPSDTGPCRGFFPRYYYDAGTSECHFFVYGGCGGNENNFESDEECRTQCVISSPSSSSPCGLPSDTGPCRGFFPRYYYDAGTRQCQFFVYGGCEGNENNFESEEECKAECSFSPLSPVCNLPRDAGPCRAFFPRYYFDVDTSQCQFFAYGGCGGNENNFESDEECRTECGI